MKEQMSRIKTITLLIEIQLMHGNMK